MRVANQPESVSLGQTKLAMNDFVTSGFRLQSHERTADSNKSNQWPSCPQPRILDKCKERKNTDNIHPWQTKFLVASQPPRGFFFVVASVLPCVKKELIAS